MPPGSNDTTMLTFVDKKREELRALVDGLDPDGPSRILLLGRSTARLTGRVGVLPGSFNPPTNAHIALAQSGRDAGLSSILYLLSKRTINKESVSGINLADRLALLDQIARPVGDRVALTNCGLYVDQARGLRAVLPATTRIVFLVGFDKIVQILDARYYEDRNAALDTLFSIASFMVAPRDSAGPDDLTHLLENPVNRRFVDKVTPIALAPENRVLSSTRVRRGESSDVPPVVRDFIARWRPFDESGTYAARSA